MREVVGLIQSWMWEIRWPLAALAFGLVIARCAH